MTRDIAQLEAELVAERIGRLAAQRGLSQEQAHDIHGRVMKAARLRALLPHRDLSLVDTLFGMVAEGHHRRASVHAHGGPAAFAARQGTGPDEHGRVRRRPEGGTQPLTRSLSVTVSAGGRPGEGHERVPTSPGRNPTTLL